MVDACRIILERWAEPPLTFRCEGSYHKAVGAEAGAGLVVVEADGCGAVQQWWLEGLQAPVANGAAAAVTNT